MTSSRHRRTCSCSCRKRSIRKQSSKQGKGYKKLSRKHIKSKRKSSQKQKQAKGKLARQLSKKNNMSPAGRNNVNSSMNILERMNM